MSLDEIKAALTGRYTVDREIGRGGMATVYRAFDERHERSVAVKVLHPHIAAGIGAERFLREIKIAAQLTHPNILPLHDSGEVDGTLYSVMPFVEGESLRQRLERENLLPLEDAIEITRQAAAALAYAHSRGIVHRDIKPDNILLSSGQAVVADFGLARALEAAGETVELTGAGIAVGTPAYMSPEQARGETEIDARADQYSLGCVLFEMLAGEPPFPGRTVQSILVRQMTESAPSLTDMREAVPMHVAESVRKALSKTPADRFATVAQFSDAIRIGTPTPTPVSMPVAVAPSPVRNRARRWIGAATAAVGVVVLTGFFLGTQSVPFEERDWVILADFQNTTGDTVFDGSLDRAFAIGLQQSKHINVFPRSRMAETLRLMGQDTVTVLNRDIARDVALRRAIRVIINPTISRVGSVLSLGITVVDPESDEVLLSVREETDTVDDVLPALDKLTRRLRRDLGESLASVIRSGVRLDAATTPSIEALRAWSAGNRQWRQDNYKAAADLYFRALEFDSNFAMAHSDLGQYYHWALSDRERGDFHFSEALRLSDRVTYRERLTIEATAAGWQDRREDAISTFRALLAEYPDDATAWSNLGYQYLRLGRAEGAIEAYGQAIALDSLAHNPMVNLATVYNGEGQFDQALRWYERAFEIQPVYRTNFNLNGEFGDLYVQQGEFERAEEIFSWMLDESASHRSRGNRSLALLRMRQGRYADAVDHLRQSAVLDEAAGTPATWIRNRTYLAAALITRGQETEARQLLRDVHIVADTASVEPFFLGLVGRLEARIGMRDQARAALDTVLARSRPNSRGDEALGLLLRGELALAEGRADSARSHLERASVLLGQTQALYLEGVGLAQAAAGDVQAALATFERVVNSDIRNRESLEPWVLAHYHLAKLHDEARSAERAVAWYDRFLSLWSEADDDLDYVVDARRRLAVLTQSDRPSGQ